MYGVYYRRRHPEILKSISQWNVTQQMHHVGLQIKLERHVRWFEEDFDRIIVLYAFSREKMEYEEQITEKRYVTCYPETDQIPLRHTLEL